MTPGIIAFPMMGASHRFSLAGYRLPKYMLPYSDGYVFDGSVGGFARYHQAGAEFLFICPNNPSTLDFVSQRLRALALTNYKIIALQGSTRGQAETVSIGLSQGRLLARDTSLLIFNIDTIRLDVEFPSALPWHEAAGALEVARLPGDHWSFVEPSANERHRAIRTSEKVRISDLCSTGLYWFASPMAFQTAFEAEIDCEQWNRRQKTGQTELYVAPIFNRLIALGKQVLYYEISPKDMICLGTPAEYESSIRDVKGARNAAF